MKKVILAICVGILLLYSISEIATAHEITTSNTRISGLVESNPNMSGGYAGGLSGGYASGCNIKVAQY